MSVIVILNDGKKGQDMKGISRDRLNKQWIISDQWMVFFGFSAVAAIISIIHGVINAIL